MKLRLGLLPLTLVAVTDLSALGQFRPPFPSFVWENLPLHSAIEAWGALAAILLALVLLQRPAGEGGAPLLWPILGLLGMGILDAFHAIAPSGQWCVSFHSAACLGGGLGFSLVWLPKFRRSDSLRKSLPWCVAAGCLALGLLVLLFSEAFPAMVPAGQFTPAAIGLNLLGGVLFIAAAAYFLLNHRGSNTLESYLFAGMSLLFGLGAFAFTWSTLWDYNWWLWHLLRLAAYMIAFAFAIYGYLQTISRLRLSIIEREQAEEDLNTLQGGLEQLVQTRTAQLQEANEELQREIAVRARAEQALRASERRSRTLIEHLPQRVFLKDKDSVYLFCNEHYASDLGIHTDQIAGKTDYDFYPRELADKYRADDQRILAGGKTEEIEEEYFRKGEESVVQTLKAAVKDESGATIGVLGIFWDITERKRAEEELKLYREHLEELTAQSEERARQLARSNSDLEQFAYVASHDLQEPLRMVASYVQLLAQRYKGRLDADADEFISYAVAGATRMQALINDLLAYSRVSTRAGAFEPTDCEPVLQEALLNLKLTVEESKARITHDPLPTIEADRMQMAQLFQNLIGNAVKFRNETPPEIHVSAESTNGGWLFWVRDNGIGMDMKCAQRIFAIFARLHPAGTYPGMGIGLAICKRIVERHGGRIWVESEPGKGSTFYFTIPRKQ